MICTEHDIRACKIYLQRIINEATSALDLLSRPDVTHFLDSASYATGTRQSYTRVQLEGVYQQIGGIEQSLRTAINKKDDG
jgi:hypothetical protein